MYKGIIGQKLSITMHLGTENVTNKEVVRTLVYPILTGEIAPTVGVVCLIKRQFLQKVQFIFSHYLNIDHIL